MSLNDFLEKCVAVDHGAGSAPWTITMRDDGAEIHCAYSVVSKGCLPAEEDAEFMVFSRNNWKKLLALVRKLREQRDKAIKSACASPEANQGSETWDEMAARDITADNAALDEIVRGG